MAGPNSHAAYSAREVTTSSLSSFGLKEDTSVTGVHDSLFTVDMLMFYNVGLLEMKPVPVP
jgi:hypothetical protein